MTAVDGWLLCAHPITVDEDPGHGFDTRDRSPCPTRGDGRPHAWAGPLTPACVACGALPRPVEPGRPALTRRCLTCSRAYDRSALLARLESDIRDRYRLPPSPWSAAERAEDCS